MWGKYRRGSPPARLCICSEIFMAPGESIMKEDLQKAPHPQNLSITAMEMGHQKFWVSKRVFEGALSTRHLLVAQPPCPGTPATLQEPA